MARRCGGWRQAAKEAGRPREIPSMVLVGLGILLPLALAGGGVYAILAETVRVPAYHATLPTREVISGAVADGFGLGLIGAALIVFALIILRRLTGLERATAPAVILGLLVIAAGLGLALAG